MFGRFRLASPSTALTQMSWSASGAGPDHEKVTRFPSGENEGSSSAPGIDVRVSRRGGSDTSSVKRMTPNAATAIRTSAAVAIHQLATPMQAGIRVRFDFCWRSTNDDEFHTGDLVHMRIAALRNFFLAASHLPAFLPEALDFEIVIFA